MKILRINELRKAVGLSQVELATSMGVAQNTLSMWESETALPRTRDLPRLARVLGCSISDLFIDEGDLPAEGSEYADAPAFYPDL